jgi:hypothetical protein
MNPRFKDGDWRFIAEQVATETDPAKLTILIGKLCRALNVGRKEDEPRPGNKPPRAVV